MQIVSPSMKYKESFLQAMKEYHQIKGADRYLFHTLSLPNLRNNFQSYLIQLSNESASIHLPRDFVAQTTYWLIDNDEFIGNVSIRHSLNDNLLREGGHIGYEICP